MYKISFVLFIIVVFSALVLYTNIVNKSNTKNYTPVGHCSDGAHDCNREQFK